MTSSPKATLRQRIAEQARYRCGYCLTLEIVSGIPLTLEHIIPRAKGGSDEESNLWLSCHLCNEAKGILVEAIDPQTDTTAILFNPRNQLWQEHFFWNVTGTHIMGKNPSGRATIKALSLNSEFRVRTRAIWVEAGWHPPAE